MVSQKVKVNNLIGLHLRHLVYILEEGLQE